MAIRNHVQIARINPVSSWTDLAGWVTLFTVAALGFISSSMSDPRAWVMLVMVLMYGFINWGINVVGAMWIQHLRIGSLAAMGVIVILFGNNGFAAALMFFVLSANVMYMVPTKQGYWWIAIFGLIILAAYLTVWSSSGSVLVALGTFAGFLFFGSSAEARLKAEKAHTESKRLLGELQLAHHQLQERADQAEELAATSERNRLARDVHDTLGHQLTVAAVQLEGAQKLIRRNPDKAEEIVGTVRSQVLEGLNELRKTIATLRAPIEEDLALPSALNRLVYNFESATNIQTKLVLPADLPDLPNTHRQTIFRSVQESLTNIQKHANAENAWVQLAYQVTDKRGYSSTPHNDHICKGHMVLSIRDDGIGLPKDAHKSGFGLKGMTERASQLSGSVAVNRRSMGGTEVTVSIPIPPNQNQ